jgi:UrcA family protein
MAKINQGAPSRALLAHAEKDQWRNFFPLKFDARRSGARPGAALMRTARYYFSRSLCMTLTNLSRHARSFGLAASILVSFGLATTASYAASPGDAAPSVKISYVDLDISTDHGLKTLYGRIEDAASQVCPHLISGDFSSVRNQVVSSCRDAAIARAVEQINNPRLSALHANRKSAVG